MRTVFFLIVALELFLVRVMKVMTREDRLLPDCCFETASRESQEG